MTNRKLFFKSNYNNEGKKNQITHKIQKIE